MRCLCYCEERFLAFLSLGVTVSVDLKMPVSMVSSGAFSQKALRLPNPGLQGSSVVEELAGWSRDRLEQGINLLKVTRKLKKSRTMPVWEGVCPQAGSSVSTSYVHRTS